MKRDKILIVEDDPRWIGNHRRSLKHEDLDIDAALTSKEALEKLRTTYYALVILDLSLDPENPNNRDSLYVQEYLQKHPEGTLHIVVSGVADRVDVQTAAFEYKAFGVFFKNEFEDPTPFIEKVQSAIEESHKQRPDFLEQTYLKLLGGEKRSLFEYRMLRALQPEGGVEGYLAFKNALLETVSPMELHKTRKKVVVVEDRFVFGLFWSRHLGSAISLCLANNKVSKKEKREAMTKWLWDTGKEWKVIEKGGVKGFIHLEDSLDPEDFVLPSL